MVKDGPLMRNGIQYVWNCLLCLKKGPGKFLDNVVAIYNGTTSNAHKHMASTHPSLHLAGKCQSLEPKQLISITTFAFASTNNIRAFIESVNNAVIKHIHALFAGDNLTWSLTVRRRCCSPPLSSWTRSSRRRRTWSGGRTFQWRPAR